MYIYEVTDCRGYRSYDLYKSKSKAEEVVVRENKKIIEEELKEAVNLACCHKKVIKLIKDKTFQDAINAFITEKTKIPEELCDKLSKCSVHVHQHLDNYTVSFEACSGNEHVVIFYSDKNDSNSDLKDSINDLDYWRKEIRRLKKCLFSQDFSSMDHYYMVCRFIVHD